MFQKATTQNIGKINETMEIKNQLAETLMQIVAAQQAYYDTVNAVVETIAKSIETLVTTLLESQKQMLEMMEKIPLGQTNVRMLQLTNTATCPKCNKDAHKGGVDPCWHGS